MRGDPPRTPAQEAAAPRGRVRPPAAVPPPDTPLLLGALNVNGGVRATSAAQKVDPVTAFITSYDVCVLVETRVTEADDLPTVPGFRRFHLPATQGQGHGVSGGVAMYVRDIGGRRFKATIWSPPRTDLPESPARHALWVRIDGLAGIPLYVAGVYVPPTTSRPEYIDTDWAERLQLGLDALSSLHGVDFLPVLLGDFNAHTGSEEEGHEAAAALLEGLGVPGGDLDDYGPEAALPPRATPCKLAVDGRGEELLQLCASCGLAITNGRVAGNSDVVPSMWPKKDKQDSVVDYALLPVQSFHLAARLEVGLDKPVKSDHRPLTLTLLRPSRPSGTAPPTGSSASRPQHRLPCPPRPGQGRPTGPPTPYEGLVARVHGAMQAIDVQATPDTATAAARFQDALLGALRPLRLRPSPRRPDSSSPPWTTRALRSRASIIQRVARLAHAPGSGAVTVPERRLRGLRSVLGVPVGAKGTVSFDRDHLRRKLQDQRAAYAKEVRRARSTWKADSARSFIGLHDRDARRFWLSLRSAGQVAPSCDPATVPAYWEKLLNFAPEGAEEAATPEDLEAPRALRPEQLERLAQMADDITPEEVKATLASMKSRRAADSHGLTAECLRLLREDLPPLAALLTRFFREGFPSAPPPGSDSPDLGTSILVPIYKGKGATDDLSNFRGISILPALTKLYALVLERRLSTALQAVGLRADSQFGFRQGRGTQEAAFVLQSVLDTRALDAGAKAKRLAVFVDFQKAFDSVQRPLLWQLLRNLRVPEPFVAAVASYYSRVQFRVELPTGLTEPITSTVGVKQGCPLSPVLFGVFIEALLHEMMQDPGPLDLPSLDGVLVAPLLYADDLVLLSRSWQGLQAQCARLTALARRYGLRVNVAKTKGMAFGFAQTPQQVTLANQPVEWVESFRYLGIMLGKQGFGRTAALTLSKSALDRYHALWAKCRSLGIEDTTSLDTLFDSLVNSIAGYGAPIWGPAVFKGAHGDAGDPPAGSPAMKLEQLQRRYQRALLGLPQRCRATHALLAIETNRPPIQIQLFRTTLRFLHRLRDGHLVSESSEARTLLGHALRASVLLAHRQNVGWAASLATWAARLGAPLDLDAIVPAPGSRRSQRRPGGGAAGPPRALHAPDDGRDLALASWVSTVESTAAPRTARLLLIRGGLSKAAEAWKRRPPAAYQALARLWQRGLLARSRIGEPLGRLSVWDGDLFSGAVTPAGAAFGSRISLHGLLSSQDHPPDVPDADDRLLALLRRPPRSWVDFLGRARRLHGAVRQGGRDGANALTALRTLGLTGPPPDPVPTPRMPQPL